MTRPSTLTEYLNALDTSRQAAFAQLTQAVEAAIGNRTGDVASLTFVAGAQSHPTFPDHAAVWWLAVEQLLLEPGALAGELPLAFFGYHGKVRFSRKRYAQGFLLTDARIASRDDFEPFGEQPPVRTTWIGEQAADAAALAWKSFDTGSLSRLVGPQTAAELRELLVVAAGAAQAAGRAIGHVPPSPPVPLAVPGGATAGADPAGTGPALMGSAIPAAGDLAGRVRDLALSDAVTLPGTPKNDKRLAKLAKAVGMPPEERIELAVFDTTLAGAYGMLVTSAAVRSRDLMEPPVATPREQVEGVEFVVDDCVRLAPGQSHTLPTWLTPTHRESLTTLLRERLLRAE